MFDITQADWEQPEFQYSREGEWPTETYIQVNKVGGGTVGKLYLNEYWFAKVVIRSECVMLGEMMIPKNVDHLHVSKSIERYLLAHDGYSRLLEILVQASHWDLIEISDPTSTVLECTTCGAQFREGTRAHTGGLCPGFPSALHARPMSARDELHASTCAAYAEYESCRHTCHTCECDLCTGVLKTRVLGV